MAATRAIPPHRMDIPLAAVQFTDSRGAQRHAVFCPWCEALHLHGAGGGHRAAGEHCHPQRGSPLGGYVFSPARVARCEDDAIPSAPLAGKRRLATDLSNGRPALTRAVAQAIMRKEKAHGSLSGRIDGTRTQVIFCMEANRVEVEWGAGHVGSTELDRHGKSLIDLAAFLYGVTPGVATVRILEAATGECLDADTALAVSYAVDQWHARGSPRGEGRRL
jgi:hypothetical protein